VEDATYYERKNNEKKGFGVMVDETWGIQYNPQSIFKSFQGRPCLSGVFTGETQAKFEQVLVTMDQNQRRKLNDEIADNLMNKEFVVVPLTVITKVAVCNNKVKGFEFPAYAYDLGRCLINVYIEK
jgi:nickel transport system substrate-binding protein